MDWNLPKGMPFLLAAPLALFALASCDSSTGSGSGPGPGGTGGAGTTTLVVGADSYLPIVGGYHESAHATNVGGVPDTVAQTTVNFITAGAGGSVRFNGSVLLVNPSLSTYPLDTAYYRYDRPLAATMSFFRYRPGVDTCYYSSMSGSLQVTEWRDTTATLGPGHKISGTLTARMAPPWAQRFASCSEPLDVRFEFRSAYIANGD